MKFMSEFNLVFIFFLKHFHKMGKTRSKPVVMKTNTRKEEMENASNKITFEKSTNMAKSRIASTHCPTKSCRSGKQGIWKVFHYSFNVELTFCC